MKILLGISGSRISRSSGARLTSTNSYMTRIFYIWEITERLHWSFKFTPLLDVQWTLQGQTKKWSKGCENFLPGLGRCLQSYRKVHFYAFSGYPHDSFYCPIEVESKYHRVKDLVFRSKLNVHDMFNTSTSNSPFDVTAGRVEDCITSMSRSYSNIILHMSRNTMTYFISAYLPCILLILATHISFFIPPDNIPGRMSLIVTILLMFLNNYGNIRNATPLVSKISMLDVWSIGCILFVTMALFEYAIILNVRFNSTECDERLKARCHKLDSAASVVSISLYMIFVIIYFAIANQG